MVQKTTTFALQGGLNLITPPISMPPGYAVASLNYEPELRGYRSHAGYERYDGQPSPSEGTDSADVTARRAAITTVPGTGPVRGVVIYNNTVHALRDGTDGYGHMFVATSAGWEEKTFGHEMQFITGTAEFLEGETLTGFTSGATAVIQRVVLRDGGWAAGDAEGFLVVSNIIGTFQSEVVTSAVGSATASPPIALTLTAGGYYNFIVHNFFGGAKTPRLYAVNGQNPGWEWDGTVLAPIRTGSAAGLTGTFDYLIAANGDFLLADNDDYIILSAEFDRPQWISHLSNHLFLGYDSGSLINSSLGEPLSYLTTTGAGETAFGDPITGLLSTTTALVIFGRNAIDYMTGSDASDFLMQHVSENSGAIPRSPVVLDQPVYVDDGGIRQLSATAAFGDWQMGTMSALVEPLMKQKRDTGVTVAAAIAIKSKDQHRLFWNDGTGLVMYIGRKHPELMPFKLPVTVFCAGAGELASDEGERIFIGCEDGYVYEMEKGTSFDGEAISAYVRLAFNQLGAPTQNKVFRKITAEVESEADITLGVALDFDYARGVASSQVTVDVDAGLPTISTEAYGSIDWTVPVAGLLEHHIAGIGRNMAITFISSASDQEPHSLASVALNFSPRGLIR